MKKLGFIVVFLFVMGTITSVFGADVSFHGDLNNRFMVYTNHSDFIKAEQRGTIDDGNVEENWGEIKYRFWAEAASNDGDVKGVYAIEIGGIHFGKPGGLGKGTGGSYSGDSVNIETRWAYTDFQLPFAEHKSRVKIGLQPFKVNKYLWSETAMGVNWNGSLAPIDYQLAWMRTYEFKNEASDNNSDDVDNFLARINVKPVDDLKAGFFVLYQLGDPDEQSPANYGVITPENYLAKKFVNGVNVDYWSFGIDGSYSPSVGSGEFFVNWDLIYQTGSIDKAKFGNVTGDFDLSAYFAHFDVGYKTDNMKFTYTFWYTSGDDNPNDNDFDGFLATDLDITDSIVLFEGNYSDDDVFSERHYLLDKGFIMNKLAFDYKFDSKLKMGASLLYMMTAEDIEYTDNLGRQQNQDTIGLEVDAYIKYMIYKNVEVALNAGYLFADDAMDYFEVDKIKNGSSDEDIFLSAARIRYKF